MAIKHVEKIRDDCMKLIDSQHKVVLNEVLDRDEKIARLQLTQDNVKSKVRNMDQLINQMDGRIKTLQTTLQSLEETNYDLNVKVLGLPDPTAAISFLEGELRQMRMLNQQNIEQTQKQLTQAISQKECEQTCLKFNFDMMQSIIEKLELENERNMFTKDQLYLEFK